MDQENEPWAHFSHGASHPDANGHRSDDSERGITDCQGRLFDIFLLSFCQVPKHIHVGPKRPSFPCQLTRSVVAPASLPSCGEIWCHPRNSCPQFNVDPLFNRFDAGAGAFHPSRIYAGPALELLRVRKCEISWTDPIQKEHDLISGAGMTAVIASSYVDSGRFGILQQGHASKPQSRQIQVTELTN